MVSSSSSPQFNCSDSPLNLGNVETGLSEGRIIFMIVLMILLLFTSLVFPPIFWYAKNHLKQERLRLRKASLVYLGSICNIIVAITGPGIQVIGYAIFPCWLRSFLIMLIVPFVCTSMLVRFLTFFFLNQLHQVISKLNENNAYYKTQEEQSTVLSEQENETLFSLVEAEESNQNRNQCKQITSSVLISLQTIFGNRTTKNKNDVKKLIIALTFITSNKGVLTIIILTLIPFLALDVALTLQDPTYIHGCTNCRLSMGLILEILIAGIVFGTCCIFALFLVRKYPDPWKFRREVGLMTICGLISLIGFAAGSFITYPQDDPFDFNLFVAVGFSASLGVQTIFQVYLGKQAVAEKKQELERQRRLREKRETSRFETLSSQHMLDLQIIMKTPDVLKLFESFLASELGMESLMFLRDSENWRQSFFDISPSARLARVNKIYKTYIYQSGSFPVNVSSRIIADIKSAIVSANDEGGETLSRDLFEEASEEIKSLLNAGAVKRFENSHYFVDSFTRTLSNSKIGPVVVFNE